MSNLEMIKLSDVQAEELRFLVEPHFPLGKFVLCAGDGNVGKTSLMLAIAAKLTIGEPLPWERDQSKRAPANIIFNSMEDGLGDTIVPRLQRLGADCERVDSINDTIYPLTINDLRIEDAIVRANAKLPVLDPIDSYIEKGKGAGKFRPMLTALADVAARTGCTICGITHLNKSGGKSQYRTLGSVDLPAISRSVLTVGKLPDDEGIRVFIHSKSNLTAPAKPQAFGFDEKTGLVFVGEVDVTLDEMLDGKYDEKKRAQKPPTKRDDAKDFIIAKLAGGEVSATEIKLLAEDAGISKNTLERAKSDFGVRSFQRDGAWLWALPDTQNAIA
jgi:hypothetical protein